jgi:hypothetical protein
MKATNHDQPVIFGYKKQRIREPAQEGAADFFEHGGKLPRIFAHPFDQSVNRFAKTSA